jgi:hypothetical protein
VDMGTVHTERGWPCVHTCVQMAEMLRWGTLCAQRAFTGKDRVTGVETVQMCVKCVHAEGVLCTCAYGVCAGWRVCIVYAHKACVCTG